MWVRVALLVSIVLAVAPSAQQPARTAPRTVAGVVRDAVTRAPIAGARVRVGAFNHEWCEPCLASSALPNAVTDSAGRFSIDDAPGTFVLEADRTGFAVGGFGVRRPAGRAARIDLVPGQHLDDLEILLFREAVITGRVTDETGAPVAGLTVELARIDARGRWTSPAWNSAEIDPYKPVTDETGYYTAHVAPDEYAVAAIRGQVPAFHPAEDRLQSAALVTVDPGEVLTGIDVQLPPRRVGLVRGRFQIPSDSKAMRLPASARLRNARFEIHGGFDGDLFVVDNVPYGDYSLEITASRFGGTTAPFGPLLDWWARVPVRVDAATVEVDEVPPQRALAVSGRITSPGAKTAGDWSGTGLQLLSLDDGEHCGSRHLQNAVSAGGEFTLMTMPGRFRLCASPQNRFGSGEATLNGQDLVDLPFAVGGDVPGIKVFQPAGPARLRGVVQGAGGRPVREGWVVAFPSDRRYWPQAVAEGGRFAATRVSVAGTFQVDTLLPAEYFVAAVDDPSIDGWPMESWLAGAAEGAVRATLGRSQTRTLSPVRLRTIPVERAP
ncbi:MAG TPA: carboxypeptidase-like regulatory domain-containing protein, partial [Vicinamibacterales bacterium]|nr:carboxypeptidase-like regulatory domain-containing protein [Vicinamibacterales bacterium]